jgi:hypothetical protein
MYPNVQVLMVLPYWDSATWWPQLIKMKAPKVPCLRITPFRGMFKNCWGEEMPPPQMGPNLSNLLRQILQGKQIQNSTIEDFISKNQSLKRYQSSFHLLWEILVKSGVPPPGFFGSNCICHHSIVSVLPPRQEMLTVQCYSSHLLKASDSILCFNHIKGCGM